MQIRRLRFPVLLLAAMLLGPAISAETPRYWTKLMLSGKHNSGAPRLLEAVDLAEKFGEEDPRLHLALHAAAMYGAQHGESYRQTELLFNRDIALLEKIDIDFPDLVSDFFELARLYEVEGRYAESERLLLRALAIRKKWEDVQSDDPFNATIYGELFMVYNDTGQSDKANEAYAQMLEGMKQLRTRATRATCFHSSSNLFYEYTRCHKRLPPEQTKRFLETALKFAKDAIANYKYAIDLSNELRNVGTISLALNEPKQSEQYFKQALEMAFDQMESIPDVALWDLYAMTDMLFAEHRYHDVEQWQARYLQRTADTFGAASREYGKALSNCADSWYSHKYPDKAEKLKKQSRAIVERLAKQ